MLKHISLIFISTAAYALALGWWRSLEMALYVAVKLPIVFIGSTFIVSVFAWMAGLVLGSALHYRDVVALVFSAMATASRMLLGLVLVVLFFIFTAAPNTGCPEDLRFAHAILLSVHIFVFSVAGVIGHLSLIRELRQRVARSCRVSLLVALWLGMFALVGCQTGWMMRPLVGSPNIVVEFLRADALESNFLESVVDQIIPHIINKGVLKNERSNAE